MNLPTILSEKQRRHMLTNGRANARRIAEDGDTHDFWPVVKLYCPWSAATWLLTELDPEDPDIAFGLCDLGTGSPDLGTVRMSELEAIVGPGGLRIEADITFKATRSLSAYADEALRAQCIKA